MRRLVLGLLMAAAVSPALADEPFAARVEALAAHVTVALPEGEGPFPVVVQLHGCGGRKGFQDTWAEAFRRAGFAAVVVDSFAPRGISTPVAYATVCTGLRLRGDERAGDVFAALAWARAQPWADRERLAVAGWSHGGWTALDALTLHPGDEAQRATGLSGLPAEPLAGLRAVMVVYPYAGRVSRVARRPWRLAPPTLAILGTADAVTGWRQPGRVLERLAAEGVPLELTMFDGATHAFDEPDARDPRVRHDPALAAEAERLATDFLARRLR